MTLTRAEKRIVTAVGYDEAICDLIKRQCRGPLRRMTAFTDESERKEADGVAVAVSRDKAVPIIDRLQPRLLPRGYRAFWSEVYNANGLKRSEVVVVLKSVDESEIIRLQRTNGSNYDVSTAALLQRLESWRGQCELRVVGAAAEWVAIQFVTLPPNICAFAEEVYEFCPDTVDQGVGLQNEKDHPERFEAARRLCPKLSRKTERKLREQKAQFEAMEIPPEIRAAIQSSGFTTPPDMGIRLLALDIRDSKQLFLWWD